MVPSGETILLNPEMDFPSPRDTTSHRIPPREEQVYSEKNIHLLPGPTLPSPAAMVADTLAHAQPHGG